MDTVKLDREYKKAYESSVEKRLELFNKQASAPPLFDRSPYFEDDLNQLEKELEERERKDGKLKRIQVEIRESITELKKILLNNIENGYIKAQLSKDGEYKLKMSGYIVWLDSLGIAYPKALKNCVNPLIGGCEPLFIEKASVNNKKLEPVAKGGRATKQESNKLEKMIRKIIALDCFEKKEIWRERLQIDNDLGLKLSEDQRREELKELLNKIVLFHYGKEVTIKMILKDKIAAKATIKKYFF